MRRPWGLLFPAVDIRDWVMVEFLCLKYNTSQVSEPPIGALLIYGVQMNYKTWARLCSSTFSVSLVFAAIFWTTACVSSSKNEVAKASTPVQPVPDIAETQDPKKMTGDLRLNNVLKTAFSQVGTPYYYGGNSPQTGFDCSGFVKWVYGEYGIDLPRTSGSQLAAGTPVKRKDLKPGDLVFFGKKKRITHVGIYTGDNNYIHSPRRGKPVQENSVDSRARGEYYAGARRLLTDHNVTDIDYEVKTTWLSHAKDPAKAAKLIVAKAPKSAETAAQPAPKLASTQVAKADTTKSAAAPAAGAQIAPTESATAAALSDQVAENILANKTMAQSTLAATPAPPAVLTKPATQAKTKRHKVSSGDTLSQLAQKYGVTTSELAKANKLSKSKMANLQLGQLLIIPN